MSAAEIFKTFENQRVLIIGDVMLDRYVSGQVTRISPEAPVPVVQIRGSENRLGGAANVALNVRALGGEAVLCSVVGEDADAEILLDILPKNGLDTSGFVFSKTRKTTVKTRILGNNQQMLRLDSEDTHDLDDAETSLFLKKIEEKLAEKTCDVVIFQDYNKGVLTEQVIGEAIAWAQQSGIPTAVDPKKRNFFAYRGVDFFKPNLKETRESVPFPVAVTEESLSVAVKFLQEQLHNRLTMITLSERGLFLSGENGGQIYPTKTRNVADVSGAGDTVISVAAMGLAAGFEEKTLAALSNLAGGLVCETPGVVPVSRALLRTEFEHWQQINQGL